MQLKPRHGWATTSYRFVWMQLLSHDTVPVCWTSAFWGSLCRVWSKHYTQIAKFMGPTWGPPGPCRPQMVPMWAHELCYQGICVYVSTQVSARFTRSWTASAMIIYCAIKANWTHAYTYIGRMYGRTISMCRNTLQAQLLKQNHEMECHEIFSLQ